MLKVKFYEAFEEEALALRKVLPQSVQAEMTSETIQASGDGKLPAPVISVRTQSVIPEEWASGLKGILTRSAGYDHLEEYLGRVNKKIPCGYLPDYCARAVAEQAALMVMALLRKLPAQQAHFDRFDRDGLTGLECKGRNLLVVGVGRIGREVADVARGLRMNVKGVDIDPREKDLEYVALPKGLAWAEAAVCCLPLTYETKGMLNGACLKAARRGLVFVNISRGEISPAADLRKLLDQGHISGLGMDVYEDEEILAESLRTGAHFSGGACADIIELRKRTSVILTPHNAFNTVEAVRQKAQKSALALEAFAKKKAFPDPVPL